MAPAQRKAGLFGAGHSASLPWGLVLPALIFLGIFFVAPLIENVFRSVDPARGSADYVKIFTDSFYLGVVWNTLWLSAVVTALCVVVGYPVAYLLVRHAGRWSGLLVFVIVAPLLTSIIMRSFGWLVLLSRQGLVNRLLLDMGIIDAPLRMSNGVILVFMMASGSFVTLLILGGGAIQTLPLLIYQQFNVTRDFAFGAALSNVLLVLAVLCLYLQLTYIKRRGAD